ncbi:hypothetical protein M011DRAFT_392829, partial [Sporormia fimetaria CBS 119925]
TIPNSTSQTSQLPPQTASSASKSDADFHAAFPHLAPNIPSSSTTPSTTSSTTSSTQQTPEPNPAHYEDYPRTMSCRAAFDTAFYCASLGGHFNDIYRYGELRQCSEQWADWRFCMGLKTRTKADREGLIQERYKAKEEKMLQGPNSEQVWKRRAFEEREFGAF